MSHFIISFKLVNDTFLNKFHYICCFAWPIFPEKEILVYMHNPRYIRECVTLYIFWIEGLIVQGFLFSKLWWFSVSSLWLNQRWWQKIIGSGFSSWFFLFWHVTTYVSTNLSHAKLYHHLFKKPYWSESNNFSIQ